MGEWVIVAYGLVCAAIGLLAGILVRKKSKKNLDGILIVDKVEPNANEGVYFQAFEDPQQTYKNGQLITLKVMWFTQEDLDKAMSQQNQG